MYYVVSADFDDARELRPDQMCYLEWAEAADAIKRGAELGCAVIVSHEDIDETTLGPEAPDLDDWPSARHVVVPPVDTPTVLPFRRVCRTPMDPLPVLD